MSLGVSFVPFAPLTQQRTSSAASTNSSDGCEPCEPAKPAFRINYRKTKKEKKQFTFPEGGWECSHCQNYNFKGKEKCNRCKKDKDTNDIDAKPEHCSVDLETKEAIREQRRALGRPNDSEKKFMKNNKKNNKNQDHLPSDGFRPGDWTCYQCQNFNYSFRDTCYKCNMT